MIQLECSNLTLGYDNKAVVSGLSFSVSSGDYLCILGENGSGKSTLMKAILHLHAPLSGSVATKNDLRPNEIGYLPQQTLIQRDFPASVYEIVLSGCLNRIGTRFFYSKAEKDIAMENIQRLEISHLAGRCYRELSGGQQQRVLLARALCATRKMLLLDEPVSGLDPLVSAEMYTIIEKLNKEDGITVIMISHDMSAAIKYASHILHIGSPVFFGTRDEYTKSSYWSAFSAKEGAV